MEWLSDKPTDWALVISLRAALRSIPTFNNTVSQGNAKVRKQFLLETFGACIICEIALTASSEEIKKAADNASNANFISLAARSALRVASKISNIDYKSETVFSYRAARAALPSKYSAAFSFCAEADLKWLEKNINLPPQKLLAVPLWHNKKNPLSNEWQLLIKTLIELEPNWQFWINYYQSKLNGTLHDKFQENQQEEIYYKISTFPRELWESGSELLNGQIAELLKEYKNNDYDFFLSYSTRDEAIAKRITKIIEPKGHTVFAQFKDMPVGSNFMTEMQEGLENSSKFICLYSENYWTSDYCQQEWNAAITFDPRGKKRKIIPFLISESAIPPLARPLVYKNLIGLNDEEFQKAVLEAIESDGVITSEQARKVAKETISPEPFINDDQELDIRANEAYDQQRVTEDLLDMPDLQSNIIEILLAHCEKSNSVPSVVKNSLNKYLAELTKNNIQARVTVLDDAVDFLEIQMEEENAEVWLDKTIEKGLSKLLYNHSKIKSHFPLDPIRQENYKEAPIDPHILDDQEFLRKDDKMKFVTKDLEKEGKVTSEFLEYLKQQNERLIEILSINPSLISKSPDDAVLKSKKELDLDDLKKRHLLQKSGFVDRLSETLNKPDKIVASPSLNLLAKIAKELGDWIWK